MARSTDPARPGIEPTWEHKYEPRREHVGPDGGRIIATDRELMHLDADGRITGTSPNGAPGWQIVNLESRLGLTFPVPIEVNEGAMRPTVPTKNGDDLIFETYIKHANVTGYFEREARSVWALFKSLTDGTLLKDATRDDGRKVVEYFEAQKLKSATIQKKVGWLNAAVNLAIKEGRLKFNPFSSVVPRRDDKQIR